MDFRVLFCFFSPLCLDSIGNLSSAQFLYIEYLQFKKCSSSLTVDQSPTVPKENQLIKSNSLNVMQTSGGLIP